MVVGNRSRRFAMWGALSWAAAPAARAGVFPYEVHTRTLDNGLTVHVVPMNTPGVAAWGTWMSVGSRDEVDEGRSGFAHFFEHLMFLGTETLAADERERALVRMAADDNAWTWLDETVYHTLVPASSLERLVGIEGDRFRTLRLTPDDVRREAGAVYGEFRKSAVNPAYRLREAMWSTAFRAHPYGHTTLGHEADIADMPTAHAYADTFMARHYRPDKATTLAVGDVRPDEVIRWVERAYGAWEGAAVEIPPVPQEPAQAGLRRVHVPWTTPTAPRLMMGWRIPGADPSSGELAALEVLGGLLLSEVGPLHRRLVVDEGLAFSVSGGRGDFVDPSLFQVNVVARPGVALDRVEAIVREELAGLVSAVDEAAVAAVKSHERYAFLSGLDDPMTVLEALGWALRRGGHPGAVDAWFARFDAVTAADVGAAAARWLVDDGLTVATLAHADGAAGAP